MTPDRTSDQDQSARDATGQQPELKRWPPQPESAADKAEDKSFKAEEPQPTTGHERKINAPHAKPAEQALEPDEKHDQLAHKADQSEDRQEALIDEGVEETFPASDPVSVKRIT
jgi:hypothetical protein